MASVVSGGLGQIERHALRRSPQLVCEGSIVFRHASQQRRDVIEHLVRQFESEEGLVG